MSMPGIPSVSSIPEHMLSAVTSDGRLLYDSFVAADGTDISGRTPEKTAGGNWYVALGTWDVQGNTARHGANVDDGVLVSTGIGANLRAVCSRVTINDNFTGFCLRYSDSNNYIIAGAFPSANTWAIYKNVAGSFTSIGTAGTDDPPAGDVLVNLELQCSTINIVIYEDGVERIRSTGDSFNDGADGIGFYADPLSASDSIYDDITVWFLGDGIAY